jgi:hypothetical protein
MPDMHASILAHSLFARKKRVTWRILKAILVAGALLFPLVRAKQWSYKYCRIGDIMFAARQVWAEQVILSLVRLTQRGAIRKLEALLSPVLC